LKAKQHGYADRQLAHLWQTTEQEIRRQRIARGIVPVFKLVDTCAAEFEAYTPYYYSAYESPVCSIHGTRMNTDSADRNRSDLRESAESAFIRVPLAEDETRPHSGKDRIMILGGGPNRIGQGIEFDYCCCQAAFALREA